MCNRLLKTHVRINNFQDPINSLQELGIRKCRTCWGSCSFLLVWRFLSGFKLAIDEVVELETHAHA